MSNGPFGVNLDAAVSEINAKHAASGEGDAAPATGGAPDTDLAPEVPLEGDQSADAPEADGGKAAEASKVDATAKEPTDDGTEFGITADGKINLFGKQYSPNEVALALEKLEKIEADQAEFQKYNEHFRADLAHIRRDPSLVHQMREAGYPERFVAYAMRQLKAEGIQVPAEGAPAESRGRSAGDVATAAEVRRALSAEDLPKDLLEKIERAHSFAEKQEVQALGDGIGRIYDSIALAKKIDPKDHQTLVKLADAELSALSSKHSILDESGRVREDLVRRVYQTAHRSLQAQIDKRVRSVVSAQKKANSSVRDNGNGGVVPTRPAEQPKTIRGATSQWLKEVGG